MRHRWAITTARTPTKEVSIVTRPVVNAALRPRLAWSGRRKDTQKAPCGARGQWILAAMGSARRAWESGAEARGFDQAHLISPGGEFPPLVALNHDPTSRLDPDDPSPHPAKRGRFQHLDHITGL